MVEQSRRYDERALTFGPFTLHRSRKLLLEDRRVIRVGSRALDLLTLLCERAGEVLSKEELIAFAWPQTIVEENSLRVNVASLRRALGDGQAGMRYIVNVPGRGYCFVARVDYAAAPTEPRPTSNAAVTRATHNLPVLLTRLVGRGPTVALLAGELSKRHFISIVGAGGIGKTTVALAVAERELGNYRDGACFVDLAPVKEADVGRAIAETLGLSSEIGEMSKDIENHLRNRQLLLLLDNCEHVINAAAHWAARLLKVSPGLHVLVTSREPLKAEGEWIYRIAPLASPPDSVADAASALNYPAAELFAERALASQDDFQMTDGNAAPVGELCRRLDGLPLAIELAAAQVAAFGVDGLLARLTDRFLLLTTGYRTVMPRHQTLGALLDWSYDLLTGSEQSMFRRLAVFQGSFDVDAATAVASASGVEPTALLEDLGALAAKSLLATEVDELGIHYRMLDTTRTHALVKLKAAGEEEAVSRQLVRHLCGRMEQAVLDWARLSVADWKNIYGRCIEDMNGALQWAFSDSGDTGLGIALVLSAQPLANQFSLTHQYSKYLQQALRTAQNYAPAQPDVVQRLRVALGIMSGQGIGYLHGNANELDPTRPDIETLYASWVVAFSAADYPEAQRICEALGALAREKRDFTAALTADRMLAQCRHCLGDHASARTLAERVLLHPSTSRKLTVIHSVDVAVSMRIILARIDWIEGFSDRALRIALDSLELSRPGVAYGRCQALAWAVCPVALWSGNATVARAGIDELITHANRHALHAWKSWGLRFADLLAGRTLQSPLSDPAQHDLFSTLTTAGIDALAVERIEAGTVGWCAPEALRTQGEIVLSKGQGRPEAEVMARAYFARALQMAQDQGALSWELRAATSMTRLDLNHGRLREGFERLNSVLRRMPEGRDTRDVQMAQQMMVGCTPKNSERPRVAAEKGASR